jgi:dsDNA-specific endonuclease/ATPase MutS2
MKKEALKALKQQLHEQCLQLVSEKISGIQQAMDMLESSMREETKSSAGDKYETGREMIKQEVEKLSVQLQEVIKQQQLLQQPNLLQETQVVEQGALVLSDKGNFYLSVGLGQLVIGEKKFIAVSPVSPLAQKMMGLKQADKFIFNAQEYTLLHIL